jgi:hypothetical protein
MSLQEKNHCVSGMRPVFSVSHVPDLYPVPPPAIFQLLLQTKHFLHLTHAWPRRAPCMILGRRLGDPWVTQGPPKPNPKVPFAFLCVRCGKGLCF